MLSCKCCWWLLWTTGSRGGGGVGGVGWVGGSTVRSLMSVRISSSQREPRPTLLHTKSSATVTSGELNGSLRVYWSQDFWHQRCLPVFSPLEWSSKAAITQYSLVLLSPRGLASISSPDLSNVRNSTDTAACCWRVKHGLCLCVVAAVLALCRYWGVLQGGNAFSAIHRQTTKVSWLCLCMVSENLMWDNVTMKSHWLMVMQCGCILHSWVLWRTLQKTKDDHFAGCRPELRHSLCLWWCYSRRRVSHLCELVAQQIRMAQS